MFEVLNTSGFLFTQTGLPVSLARADYGDGYAPPAAIVGSPNGLRGWALKIDALPNTEEGLIGDLSRADYLWEFWNARKREGNVAFWIQDPKDDKYYLVEFTADELSYELLCSLVYSTGLQLRQRRDRAQASPVTILPGTPAPPDWPVWGETEWGGS